MGDITVLVPEDEGEAALAGVAGVEVVRYDPDGVLPAEAARAQVLVPPFLAPASAVSIVERLPELRLVQLLTAGAEAWVGRLPAGVALAVCRGPPRRPRGGWR